MSQVLRSSFRSIAWIALLVIWMGLETPVSAEEDTMTNSNPKPAKATVAGGCFWCLEPIFDQLEGVFSTTPGYTGGTVKNPAYEQVSAGTTGHAEAVEIAYDRTKVSYEKLLDVFWRNIDPTQANGQFADIGTQYRTAIFYHDEEQKRIAESSRDKLAKSGKFTQPIVTQIVSAGPFYPAEEYHEDYYKKNPIQYNRYKEGSGRAGFVRRMWGEKK
ncbi:MAG: peptide-methionine (S)-S-oxide reductase MsrA [Candidatus Omnitrophica bacterium]|nr:peptide-methionine (S)-S-oxide reductase MsrA [Candidatus Omnitrophota bacterium]